MSQEAASVRKFDVKNDYILGASAAETDRLVAQAAIIQPITRRLLSNAGLGPGMRVLDIGCGPGDVALLASEIVGPEGSVIGIDQNASLLAHARARPKAAGRRDVEFQEHSLASFNDPDGFDLVVGRYVLVHQNTFMARSMTRSSSNSLGRPRIAKSDRADFMSYIWTVRS